MNYLNKDYKKTKKSLGLLFNNKKITFNLA